jgi:hypothetical protein
VLVVFEAEMAVSIDLSSESDSDGDMDTDFWLLYLESKKKTKSVWKSNYVENRETRGEFAATKEYSDERFKNYFRLDRKQFEEVHTLIRSAIYSEGCNAQKPIGCEEKMAVFLR